MQWLSCVRGGSTPLPVVQVISEQELVSRASNGPSDPEADAMELSWNTGLARFRLAPREFDPAEQTRAQAGQVGAVYFADDRTIAVVDRGQPMNDRASVATLAHELVHALQDREWDLREYRRTRATTFDGGLALRALTEGEAVHYGVLARLALEGRSPGDIDWESFYRSWQGETLAEAEADQTPVAMAWLYFPYAFGGGFVSQRWLARGPRGVQELFADPPQTTRAILFGAPTGDDEELNAVRQHGLPNLPSSFTRSGTATLGAWIARMYVARMDVPWDQRAWYTRQLVADVFTVQTDSSTGQHLAAWHLSLGPELPAASWPGANQLAFLSAWVPDGAHDLYLVGTIPGIPPLPETLTWTSVEQTTEPANNNNPSLRRSDNEMLPCPATVRELCLDCD